MTLLAKATTTIQKKVEVNVICFVRRLTIIEDSDIIIKFLPGFSFHSPLS